MLKKRNKIIFIVIFSLLFLFNLPIMTKNLLTADVLLNNYYYKGYLWEISLGRFGLYIIGIMKYFFNIVHIDLIISYTIIGIIIILLLGLFKIENKLKSILFILVIVLSPITSAILLFNYCSVGYLLGILLNVVAVYFFYKFDNKYLKYLLPIIFIVISLSIYQAYIAVAISLFVIYNIKLIIDDNYTNKSLIFIILLIISILLYYIIMKLSIIVFGINMSSYGGASKVSLKLIEEIPEKIINTYRLFYEFYFKNNIIKNTYVHNDIISLILFILFIGSMIYKTKYLSMKKKIAIYLLIFTIPIYINSVIFFIPNTKMQLLMSWPYLLIYLLIIDWIPNKIRYLYVVIFILLFRNNIIQTQSTYLTLEDTFNRYDTIITKAIMKNDNNYPYVVIRKEKKRNDIINKLNYGFISDGSIFWEEYNLRRLGFKRFCRLYHGSNVKYVSEEIYKNIGDTDKDITIRDNIVIINLEKLE